MPFKAKKEECLCGLKVINGQGRHKFFNANSSSKGFQVGTLVKKNL